MNILEEILENKRQEVAHTKITMPLAQLNDMPGYSRRCLSLQEALQTKDIAVIAEIKKASPSKGVIREDFNPVKIADEYVAGGAAAISVLTDKRYFQGHIYFINDIRFTVPIPILRKDFIIDSYQLVESKGFGADAVLLIAAALESNQLRELHTEANERGLECLVEVHNEKELEMLNLAQVKMVGINNRNLSDFTIDVSTTLRVASCIPAGITVVSESGISNRADIDKLAASGIHAVLVGESLMRSSSPGDALRELLTPSKERTQ
jgi:indole-3-glycerol phosphate synthase